MIQRLSSLVIAAAAICACTPLPGLRNLGAYRNAPMPWAATKERVPSEALNATGADVDFDLRLASGPVPDGRLIGLGISGGGSRAAVFGAAVMLELDRLGVLGQVQYLSAVSGGSLPASYYALFKDDPDRWNAKTVRNKMSQNFEGWALTYLLNPLLWPRFLGTSYDRTDVLASVFNRRLLDRRTFGDFTLPKKPVALLNATDLIGGERFVFWNGSFDAIGSDLSRLPVAVGVAASAAFPAALRAVTLRDFNPANHHIIDRLTRLRYPPEEGKYVHLIDGGVIDNLGLDTLERVYALRNEDGGARKGCLFILIDAEVAYDSPKLALRPDTRRFVDAIVDTNALAAINVVMSERSRMRLETLGFDQPHWSRAVYKTERRGYTTYSTFKAPAEIDEPPSFLRDARVAPIWSPRAPGDPPGPADTKLSCRIWHIALKDLTSANLYRDPYREMAPDSVFSLGDRLTKIPTRFKISRRNVDDLFEAARLLVREPATRRTICSWLDEFGHPCSGETAR